MFSEKINLDELVLNWHITEACNYRCGYCYAKWNISETENDLCNNEISTEILLKDLYRFFSPSNHSNPLARWLSWKSVRLNLAGGEPTLYKKKLPTIIQMADEIGFNVSMITNGSLLDDDLIKRIIPKVSLLGISVDSTTHITNEEIGRVQGDKKTLSQNCLEHIIKTSRDINPTIQIKINTVVNNINCDEDMTQLLSNLNPDRWKVLRVLPNISNSYSIPDKCFSKFVERHLKFAKIMSVEDNDDMTESYIMIDPYGRFFQNQGQNQQQGYLYSQPITKVGSANAFRQISFNYKKFISRYKSTSFFIQQI